MGNLIQSLFSKKHPKRSCKILMLGLDGVGKTTILYSLKLGTTISTIPTIGFNVQQLKYKKINFIVWDIGGQQKLRNLWTHYFSCSRGLIFVIDSSDQQRITLAAHQFQNIISHPDMKNCILLILANKRDISTLNLQEIKNKLRLNQVKRNWALFPVCAINNPLTYLTPAFQWLIDNIDDIENPKKFINLGFNKNIIPTTIKNSVR